ncbi:BadF/BadG/BcrA/BcrD ATPase family protein [Chromatiaceae bacterium AAb-1]|nr:BadF/BadG/BcrA/BcrD ATPase family protein [Chromatiaceae bacterium AAb-1]
MWLLAIDGGATKTQARLLNTGTGQQWQQLSGPASVNNDLAGALRTVRQLITRLCAEAGVTSGQLIAAMGLAGAGNSGLHQQFCQQLDIPLHKLLLTTDARTSLYGANLGKPVVVVALGTGSVAMQLDNKLAEHQFGGWGFSIGDEGGGAWLGKQAVKQLLNEFDSLTGIHSQLATRLSKQLGHQRPALLHWLKNAQAHDYAALTPQIFELAPDCPQASRLIQLHRAAVIELIQISRAGTDLPVILLGGLAAVTRPLLGDYYSPWLQDARGNALDGAILLARQLAAEEK